MKTIEGLLKKLATEGGKIVSSGDLTIQQIAEANACDRMYVDDLGLGYVWVEKSSEAKEVSTCQCGDLSPINHGRNGALCGYCEKPKPKH